MNSIAEINRINQRELELGVKGSWHDQYKDSAYVFVGGLAYELTEGDVITIFSQFGEIADINLPRDKETGKTKGFGFLMYVDQRSTVLAVDNLNGAQVLGRTIRVDHCREYKHPGKKNDEGDYEEPEKPTYNALPPELDESDVESDVAQSEADSIDEEDPMAAFLREQKRAAKSITDDSASKRKREGKHDKSSQKKKDKDERRARKEERARIREERKERKRRRVKEEEDDYDDDRPYQKVGEAKEDHGSRLVQDVRDRRARDERQEFKHRSDGGEDGNDHVGKGDDREKDTRGLRYEDDRRRLPERGSHDRRDRDREYDRQDRSDGNRLESSSKRDAIDERRYRDEDSRRSKNDDGWASGRKEGHGQRAHDEGRDRDWDRRRDYDRDRDRDRDWNRDRSRRV